MRIQIYIKFINLYFDFSMKINMASAFDPLENYFDAVGND